MIKLFHRWLAARTIGKIDADNVTDTNMQWLYNAIVCPANCNHIYGMVHNWFNKRNKESDRMAFAGYLQAMANYVSGDDGPGGRSDM